MINCSLLLTKFPGLSVNLLLLLCLTHLCIPRARRHTRKFFELSYYNSDSGEYFAGWDDAWMVFYWIVVFTGLRTAVMDYVLLPIVKEGVVRTKKDQTRFAEQAWLLVYYSVFWPLGMVRRSFPKKSHGSNGSSTFSSTLTTGSISRISGPVGPIERSLGYGNGTSSSNTPSGFNRLWSSTSKKGGKTIGKCSRITLSRRF